MYTICLTGDVDQNQSNDKLAVWDVLVRFNRLFGEVSGTALTSKESGRGFTMKIQLLELDSLDSINEIRLARLMTELENECGIFNLNIDEATEEDEKLFAEFEHDESRKPQTEFFDEDLGVSGKLIHTSTNSPQTTATDTESLSSGDSMKVTSTRPK